MKVRAETVSVAGIVALAAGVMLAGCGPGTENESSNSASTASTTASSTASSTSVAESSAAADSTEPRPAPGTFTVKLPNLPGWSADPERLLQGEQDIGEGLRGWFNEELQNADLGPISSIKVGVGPVPDGGLDKLKQDLTAAGGIGNCPFVSPPSPVKISGFDGFRYSTECPPLAGDSLTMYSRVVAVPQTNGAKTTVVSITGVSTKNKPIDQAINLIDEQTKITVG